MPSFLPATAVAFIAIAVIASPLHTAPNLITHRAAPRTPVQLNGHITRYMWNYARFTIDIGEKVVTDAFKSKYVSPVRLSGVVGTDGISMTGTSFILEYPKPYLIDRGGGGFAAGLAYNSILYDYQSLRPTNGTIMPPITAGHAEEFIRDIKVDEEIRKLPGMSASEKEYIINTRHHFIRYGYSSVVPGDISEEDQEKVQAIYRRARTIKIHRAIIIALNKLLDKMVALAKKYGRSEYGIIEDMQSKGNVLASFIGHAVQPPSTDGVVRSFVHGGGLNGQITMWSTGLSLWMNLRLESDIPGDVRAVDTGDVKLFTLDCSGEERPLYCFPQTRGDGPVVMGRFTRFVTAFY